MRTWTVLRPPQIVTHVCFVVWLISKNISFGISYGVSWGSDKDPGPSLINNFNTFTWLTLFVHLLISGERVALNILNIEDYSSFSFLKKWRVGENWSHEHWKSPLITLWTPTALRSHALFLVHPNWIIESVCGTPLDADALHRLSGVMTSLDSFICFWIAVFASLSPNQTHLIQLISSIVWWWPQGILKSLVSVHQAAERGVSHSFEGH